MENHTTKEGVTRANYLFINTGRRVSKPLGPFPAEFTLKVFTHSNDGDEYEEKRDALRRALQDDSPGTLVHPFLGNATVVANVYTFTENFAETGRCDFSIPFSVVDQAGDNPLTPGAREANPTRIKELSVAANRSLQDASAKAFKNNTPQNKECSKSSFDSMFSSIQKEMAPISSDIAKASEYTGQALAAQEQAAFYAANPLLGFARVADQIFGIDGLTTDVFSKFKACRTLFNFGDNGSKYDINDTSPFRITPDPVTNEDAERQTNAEIVKNFMQAGLGIEAFAQAGAGTYTTVDEINETVVVLDEQFEKLRSQLTPTPEAEIYDFDVPVPDYSQAYEDIKDLRTEALKYFDQQKLVVARVEIITVAPVPASVLSYRLYGDSTRAEEILALNDLSDNMVLSGDVKVLSV